MGDPSSEESEMSLEMEMEGEPGDSDTKGEPGTGFDFSKYSGTEWESLIKELEKTKSLRSKYKNTIKDLIPGSPVPDSYIYRQRDYENIVVKDVIPTLKNIDKPFQDEVAKAPEDLYKYKTRNKIINEFRKDFDEPNSLQFQIDEVLQKPQKQPLEFPLTERKDYFDKTLPLSKEKQLSEFVSRFLNYDPDKGDLPVAVRELYYENLQRLAYAFSSDRSYFLLDYYQENLNKEDFLKNALSLLGEFKNTKVGTELIFTLENIYEIQERALTMLYENALFSKNLSKEDKKELRNEVLSLVEQKYMPLIRSKRIKSQKDISTLYKNKRKEILEFGLSNTPKNYRRKDLLFELGRLHWEMGISGNGDENFDKAIQIWNQYQRSSSTDDIQNDVILKSILSIVNSAPKPYSDSLKFQVDSYLRSRLSEAMIHKQNREKKLLWKNSKP